MVASTNHLDALDPGLSSRPSRFDRKYLFPLPSEDERTLYCEYWREKLKGKEVKIDFPKKICPAVAIITDGFSFAYMQEAFVASLLAIAGRRSEIAEVGEGKKQGGGDDGGDDDDKDLNDYELWREIKKQVKALRDDMDNRSSGSQGPVIAGVTLSKALDEEKRVYKSAARSGPASIRGQSMLPLRPADKVAMKAQEDPRSKGRVVDDGYQKAPIITDEGMFLDGRVPFSVDGQLL